MSRLIIFIAIICLGWPLYKNHLPSFFRTSSISNVMSSVLYPLEMEVYKKFPEMEKSRFWGEIIEAEYPLLENTFRKTKNTGVKMIIYLYEPECVSCRFLLGDINKLASERKDIKFMVVAFDNAKKPLSNLLNNFEDLYFKPLLTDSDNFVKFKLLLNTDKLKVTNLPSIIYLDSSSKIEQLISPGLFMKNNILRIADN